MTTQPVPNPTQRVFTAKDHVWEKPTRPNQLTNQLAYRDEDMALPVEWAEPGQLFQEPHSHSSGAHVFVVLEGEGEAFVGKGKWEKIQAGGFYVCSRNKAHAIRNTSKTQRLLWVCVTALQGPRETTQRTESDE